MADSIYQKLKWQLILRLARRLPSCQALTPLFSESLERPLTLREKILMKLHFFTCEACRRYTAQIKKMGEMVKPSGEEKLDSESTPKLSGNARERIKAALESAKKSG